MKAAYYEEFKGPITIESLPDPMVSVDSVVIDVRASGLCRSDWHGWMGHDSDIQLPHVPGHELSGEIVEVGKTVKRFGIGDRVTVPFVGGCGMCPQCLLGHHQVCDSQFQPGFTHWGSFATFVEIHYADTNLVRLPESISFETAACLGCRFVTSYRAIVQQTQLTEGQWLAVHGCGGVGLSAIMIAKNLGARVIAIDLADEALQIAKSLGADYTLSGKMKGGLTDAIRDLTEGGVHVSVDALGSRETCINSIRSLRKRGRHVQIGLMAGRDHMPSIPMHEVIANELEIVGSHGMAAHMYPGMLSDIVKGKLKPQELIKRHIALEGVPEAIQNMDSFPSSGITLVNRF